MILLSIATIILESRPPESKAPIGASLSNRNSIDFLRSFSNFASITTSESFWTCNDKSQYEEIVNFFSFEKYTSL